MPHFLNVYKLDDGTFDRWIDHEEDCPTEIRGQDIDPPINTEMGLFYPHYHVYTCGVGYWEENYGYMDLEEDARFYIHGIYEIDFYNQKVFQYDEWDSYLFFVEKQ